jgi:hypothetical protein
MFMNVVSSDFIFPLHALSPPAALQRRSRLGAVFALYRDVFAQEAI